ncbi:MAG: TolC family protein [Paludibacteraceae bacterium]|nr:TolC family protein [Paludibacteraceae bacterium]MBQ2190338.1 TolC family protein [Paludibacteraceae bacterium]MBQ2520617.1 TolC family protein [Paludibacteraceae bacterium]MBQ4019036.1 TolC family protein [Paludibacteraceae bacterium]
MKKILCFLILFMPVAGWAKVYTLSQCIDTAYANSIDLRMEQLNNQQKQLLYRQAWYNLTPNISGFLNESLSFGRSTGVDNIIRAQNIANTNMGVNASIVLFDGLAMKFNIEEAKASVLASEANMEAVRRNLALNITSMYLDVLLKKELVVVAQAQLNETEQQIERIRAKVQAHRLPEGELYEIQSQYSKEQYQLLQKKNDLRIALLNLTQAMDIPYEEDFDIIVPSEEELEGPLLPERDQVWQTALTHRPEIREAEYSLQAEQTALKGQKAAYSPQLSAQAGVSTGYFHQIGADNTAFGRQLADNLMTSVSVSLSIPIYNRMQTPTQVKRQLVAIENARLKLEQQKKSIRKEIDQAYYNALAAQSEKMAAQQAERSTAEAARYASEKYDAGRGTMYEYSQAKQNHLQAVSEQLQARYNYLFKVRILEYYMGL